MLRQRGLAHRNVTTVDLPPVQERAVRLFTSGVPGKNVNRIRFSHIAAAVKGLSLSPKPRLNEWWHRRNGDYLGMGRAGSGPKKCRRYQESSTGTVEWLKTEIL